MTEAPDTRRQDGQDAGAAARRSAAAAGFYRHRDPPRPARSRPAGRDGLQLSAVVGMRVEDYYQQGKRWWLRLQEKGGKHHAVPVHHKAEASLDAYLAAAGIAAEKNSPLWRSMPRAGGLSARRLSRVDVFRMIKRRVKTVGLGGPIATPSGPRASRRIS